MSGNLQPLSSSPPGQNISLGLHMIGQLAGHKAPDEDLTKKIILSRTGSKKKCMFFKTEKQVTT
jgi:hypothetical protein